MRAGRCGTYSGVRRFRFSGRGLLGTCQPRSPPSLAPYPLFSRLPPPLVPYPLFSRSSPSLAPYPLFSRSAPLFLKIAAQRHHRLVRLLNRDHDVFLLVSLFLNRSSLISPGGSFGDALYGLRLAPARPPPGAPLDAPLSARQRRAALLALTLVPWATGRLDRLYEDLLAQRNRERRQNRLLGRRSRDEDGEGDAPGRGRDRTAAPSTPLSQRVRPALRELFLRRYPMVRAGEKAVRFAFQLAFLLNVSDAFSPEQKVLGLVPVRVSMEAAQAADRLKSAARAARLQAVQGAIGAMPTKYLFGPLLRTASFASDHARSALILSVFGFKLLEWWYGDGARALGAGDDVDVPPPPPPPPLLPDPAGIGLPDSPDLCPLCRGPRVNPTVAATSGYAYCYACIQGHVEKNANCPVTLAKTTVEQLWRIYPGM